MLQYLALKTGGIKNLGPEKKKKTSLVEQLILESSPILEAFGTSSWAFALWLTHNAGNAKTVRNDNSSRFVIFLLVCITKANSNNSSFLKKGQIHKHSVWCQGHDLRCQNRKLYVHGICFFGYWYWCCCYRVHPDLLEKVYCAHFACKWQLLTGEFSLVPYCVSSNGWTKLPYIL